MMPSLPAGEARLEENKRLGRVLRIVQIIAANPKAWNRARLAEHFELSTRQIDKDLEMIRHGLRHELSRASTGYFFESGPLLKPMQLDLAEALALSLAAQHGRDTGSVERPAVASALSKLEEALPPEVVPYLRRAGETRVPTGAGAARTGGHAGDVGMSPGPAARLPSNLNRHSSARAGTPGRAAGQ
jgi:predicted DNA-binding transcriptional regulator YafY